MEWYDIVTKLLDGATSVTLVVLLGYAIYKGILVTQGQNLQTELRAKTAEDREAKERERADKLQAQLADNNNLIREQQDINKRTTAILETVLVRGNRNVGTSD